MPFHTQKHTIEMEGLKIAVIMLEPGSKSHCWFGLIMSDAFFQNLTAF